MNLDRIPAPVLDALENLESDPSEAVRRFAGLTRWTRRKRSARTVERIRDELGTAYREEVARVLALLAKASLREDPRMKGLLQPGIRTGEFTTPPPSEMVLSRARWLLEKAGGRLLDEEREALSSKPDGGDDRLHYILISRRMCPLTSVAISTATEYKLRGEDSSARRLLGEVLSSSGSSLMRSFAFENLAALELWRGNVNRAASALESSSKAGEDRPGPTLAWLLLALTIGDKRAAREASAMAEGMLTPNSPDIGICVAIYRSLASRGMFRVKLHAGIRRDDGIAGESTRFVIDELF